MATIIETERLRLRTWTAADAVPFATATNTAAVMRWLGGVDPDPARFERMVVSAQALQAEAGFCFWAMERRGDDALIGLCGLEPVELPGAAIDGEVEIGWRLQADLWGQGYAREAAAACLEWAWRDPGIARVVALTVPGNSRSWGLMERLGMSRRADLDFAHPAFPGDHELSTHVVYVADRPARRG